MCGADCSRKALAKYAELSPRAPNYNDTDIGWPYDASAFWCHPLYVAYLSALKEWKAKRPTPEYDHIIPHSEGGKFTPDNIRLLCTPCHKSRTRLWRKERSKQNA